MPHSCTHKLRQVVEHLTKWRELRTLAATSIQAAWRGYRVRRVISGIKYEDDDEFDYAELDDGLRGDGPAAENTAT